MGLFFRKSIGAGPFRVNLSKSGVGVSAGIRGARVGVGTRGPYVSAAKDGIYYRKHLGGPARSAETSGDQQGTMFEVALLVGLVIGAVVMLVAGLVAWKVFMR
jgi:hypothetical protein